MTISASEKKSTVSVDKSEEKLFEGRFSPKLRAWVAAIWAFTLALYLYVYLLARTALSERASHLMEAARLLGAPLSRRIIRVALPLARPAIAAGVALALMETLADYGVKGIENERASVGVAGVIGVIGTAVVAGIGFKLIARKPKKDGN